MPTFDYQTPRAQNRRRIVGTLQDEAQVFVARPLGFQTEGQGSVYLMVAALGAFFGWGCILGLCVPGAHVSSVPAVLFIGFLGIVVAATATYFAYASTVLTLAPDSMQIVWQGKFLTLSTRVWKIGSIQRFEVDERPGDTSDGRPDMPELYRLSIHFHANRRAYYLTGYPKEELDSLVSSLNRSLAEAQAR